MGSLHLLQTAVRKEAHLSMPPIGAIFVHYGLVRAYIAAASGPLAQTEVFGRKAVMLRPLLPIIQGRQALFARAMALSLRRFDRRHAQRTSA